MKNIFNKWLSLLLFLGLLGCNVDPTPVATPPSKGQADFTKYVSIGNSLTAGFADNGLYRNGQLVSYPALLAQQFRLAGGGLFNQPLFTTAQKDGSGYQKLKGINPVTGLPIIENFGTGSTGFAGAILPTLGADGKTPLFTKYTGANNNFGVPGIRVSDILTAGYGLNNALGFNPYFERLLGANDARTYVQYVDDNGKDATFFTCWLGNNDALGYAATGGSVPFTPEGTFTTNIKAILDKMNGKKGLISAIPQVTTSAFFNTVTLAALQAALQAGGAPANTNIYIATGAGPRIATASDMFLLSQQSGEYTKFGKSDYGAGAPFPYGLHPNNPLVSSAVLDTDEIAAVTAKITAYNTILQAEATARSLAYFDINPILTVAKTTGYASNGITYRLSYLTGGITSLDGIHLTPAGNAITANEMIKVINAKYGSTIPLLNTSQYSTLIIGF